MVQKRNPIIPNANIPRGTLTAIAIVALGVIDDFDAEHNDVGLLDEVGELILGLVEACEVVVTFPSACEVRDASCLRSTSFPGVYACPVVDS